MRRAALMLLGAVSLGVIPSIAHAAPTWRDLGSPSGPTSANPEHNWSFDVSEADNGGLPTIAWREIVTKNSNPTAQLGALNYSGTLFGAGSWSRVGPDFNVPLGTSNNDVEEPTAAVIGGQQYIALVNSLVGDHQVRVYRYGADPTDPVATTPAATSPDDTTPAPTKSDNWYEPVSGTRPIDDAANVTPQGIDLIGVHVAATGTTPATDQPYVAWSESNGTALQVHVKRFNGTSWEEVGTPGSINADPAHDATGASLADINGVPYLAYSQSTANAQVKILHVDRWDAPTGHWVQVGTGPSPINASHDQSGNAQDPAIEPSLTSSNGVPYVAWAENYIHAAKFVGGQWVQLGTQVDEYVDAGLPGSPADPSLAIVDGTPWVAYDELDANGVEQVAAASWNGTQWSSNFDWLGGTASGVHAGAPSLKSIGDVPIVAFPDSSDTTRQSAIRVLVYGDPAVNSTRPTLGGVPQVGSTLTCDPGTWNAPTPTFTYLWDRAPRSTTSDTDQAWAAIDGAVGPSYTLTSTDDSSRVRCRVIASRTGLGSASAVSTSLRVDTGVPTNTRAAVTTGEPITGQPLTCDPGDWTGGPDFTFSWYEDGTLIPGATGNTYSSKDFGSNGAPSYHCDVAVRNDIGAGITQVTTPVVQYAFAPYNTNRPRLIVQPPPRVAGAVPPAVGRTIQCVAGDWIRVVGDYTYQWLRNDSAIAGATSSSYATTVDDLGRTLKCQVRASNPQGESQIATTDGYLVPLPAGTIGGSQLQAGGTNELDPVNEMVVSSDYLTALNALATTRLRAVVAAETTRCQGVSGVSTPIPNIDTLKPPFSTLDRCRILLQFPSRVLVGTTDVQLRQTPTGARAACTAQGEPDIVTLPNGGRTEPPTCRSLQFTIAPVDPANPPVADADFEANVAPLTPLKVLWDVNGDGKTDAVCPGTAPVLRSLYDKGAYSGRAIIVGQNSAQTGVFASVDVHVYSGGSTSPGQLRTAQPFICATSITPPANPDLGPCITDATIGRVHVTNANLCPISVRSISQSELDKDFPVGSADYDTLHQLAQTLGLGPGVAASRYKAPPTELFAAATAPLVLQSSYLRGASTAVANTESSILGIASSAANAGTSYVTNLAGTLKRAPAALSSALDRIPGLKAAKAVFALDQVYVAKGSLTVDGVTISPDGVAAMLIPSDVRSAIPDVHAMNLVSSKVNEYLGTDLQSALPLDAGDQIHATFSDAANSAQAVLTDNLDLAKAAASNALKAAAKNLDLGPFKLAGTDGKVTLNPDGTATLIAKANIPALLGLDGKPFNIDVTLNADQNGKVKLQGLTMSAPSGVKLGVLNISDLFLSYNDAQGLDIKGKFLFPPTNEGVSLDNFKIGRAGNLESVALSYLAGTGSGIPIAPPLPLYLTKIGGGVDPIGPPITTVKGSATVSVGPSTGGGCPTAGIDTNLSLAFGGEPYFNGDADGKVELACFQIGSVHLHVDSSGYVNIKGGVNLDAGPLHIDGAAGAAIKFPNWQAQIGAHISIKDLPIVGTIGPLGGQLVISNKGAAGCVSVPLLFTTFRGGIGVRFPGGIPPLNFISLVANLRAFLGCDLSAYEPLGSNGFAARLGDPGGTTFTMPKNAGTTMLSIEGAGGAPHVTLTAPSGRAYDFTNAETAVKAADYAGQIRPTEDRTMVALKNPEAGQWTVAVAPGSVPVVRVQRAYVLPAPSVKVKVTGHGSARHLSYKIAKIPGQVVRLSEQTSGSDEPLKTISVGGSGKLDFTTAESTSNARTIVAAVEENGMPRTQLTVAKYTAPSPSVGKPKVTVTRIGTKIRVRWSKAAAANHYEVIVTGKTTGYHGDVALAKTHSLTFHGFTKTESVKVSVVAVSGFNRRGKKGTATLATVKPKKAKTKKK